MSVTLTRQGKVVHLVLSDELRIEDSAQIYRQVLAELDTDVSLTIDARHVKHLSTSAAQTLLIACRRVREVQFEGSSSEWNETVKVLGIEFRRTDAPSPAELRAPDGVVQTGEPAASMP